MKLEKCQRDGVLDATCLGFTKGRERVCVRLVALWSGGGVNGGASRSLNKGKGVATFQHQGNDKGLYD